MAYVVYKPAVMNKEGEIITSAKFDCGNTERGELIIGEDPQYAATYNTVGDAMRRSTEMGLGFRLAETKFTSN